MLNILFCTMRYLQVNIDDTLVNLFSKRDGLYRENFLAGLLFMTGLCKFLYSTVIQKGREIT